jgi:hypothetical protein
MKKVIKIRVDYDERVDEEIGIRGVEMEVVGNIYQNKPLLKSLIMRDLEW